MRCLNRLARRLKRMPVMRSRADLLNSINSFNDANLEKLKSNPKNKIVFPSEAQREEVQKLLTPVRDAWVEASDRHRLLKEALDIELAAVRKEEKG